MDNENDQIGFPQGSEDITAENHKTALTKRGILFRILAWITLILIIDIFLTITLIILERRLGVGIQKLLSLPVILTLILSVKIAIIMFSGRAIMSLFRRFR